MESRTEIGSVVARKLGGSVGMTRRVGALGGCGKLVKSKHESACFAESNRFRVESTGTSSALV